MTPQRVGGRVAPTNSGSMTRPVDEVVTARSPGMRGGVGSYTPNRPRAQVTICWAPKSTQIPTTAPMGHPQEIRPLMATTARTMMANTANGVAIAIAFVTRLVAPVWKGDV